MNKTLEAINLIVAEKQEKNIVPGYATEIEVIKKVKNNQLIELELKELEAAKIISFGRTINSRYIKILKNI